MCNFNPAEEGGLPSAERGGDERSGAGVRTSFDFEFVVSASAAAGSASFGGGSSETSRERKRRSRDREEIAVFSAPFHHGRVTQKAEEGCKEREGEGQDISLSGG